MSSGAAAPERLESCAIATSCASLGATDRAAMFALLEQHFDGVREAQFLKDLAEKDWTLRLFAGDRLVGFTSLQLYQTTHLDRPLNVLYSGDTIVAPEAWGSPTLARGWIRLVRSLQRQDASGTPWVWLLLSSGFRTYRFLPVFWRAFWPRVDAATPDAVLAMRDALARDRFGPWFDASTGIVRFPHPQRLRPSLAMPDGRSTDPHVRFFLEQNPEHASGDELVCLTTLSDDNLTPAGERMVRGSER